MKLTRLLLCCALLALLTGCAFVRSGSLVITATPEAGHPPFKIVISAYMTGSGEWSYEFELADVTLPPDEPGGGQLTTTLYKEHVPGFIKVTATNLDTGQTENGRVRIDLINQAVNMDDRPHVSSAGNSWSYAGLGPLVPKHADGAGGHFLVPMQYELFRCDRIELDPLYPGHQPDNWGFYDPDGDDWKIVDVEAWSEVLPGGEGNPDAVFPSVPYQDLDTYRCFGWENSFLIIPTWPYMDDGDDRWLCPAMALPGWHSVCHGFDHTVGYDKLPEQKYWVKITTEDEFGARRTKTFKYTLLAAGCW